MAITFFSEALCETKSFIELSWDFQNISGRPPPPKKKVFPKKYDVSVCDLPRPKCKAVNPRHTTFCV